MPPATRSSFNDSFFFAGGGMVQPRSSHWFLGFHSVMSAMDGERHCARRCFRLNRLGFGASYHRNRGYDDIN